VFGAIALIAAVAARLAYPRIWEARVRRRRPLDASGIVIGASAIDMPRENAPAVLLLHGGGDTPQVMWRLAEHLFSAGFAVRVPLLSGHGRAMDAFRRVTPAEWEADVRRAYSELRSEHEWVGVVGLSVGGSLAISLVAERGDVPALVLLAPYVYPTRGPRWVAAAAGILGLVTPYLPSRGAESIRNRDAAAEARSYGVLTPAALRAVVTVAARANAALPGLTAPTLVVQSREDNRIPPEAAQRAFDRIAATDKRLEWITGAGHVITVDYGRERVFDLSAAWLKEHLHADEKAARNP
jgi:carboxylesterase